MYSLFNNAAQMSMVSNLTKMAAALQVSNTRLSTGKRINKAADDPSGVVSVSGFSDSIARIDAMTKNGQRINSIIDTADGAMAQISSLLGTIQSDAVAAAGSTVTAEEKAAYQAEIDSAIDTIDTLVNTTSFNGKRILDGSYAYHTSGVDNAKLADVQVNSADTTSGNIDLNVAVTSAAQKGEISYSNGNLTDDVTFSITGSNGTEEFSFSSGATISDIASSVNAQSDATGVDAVVDGGTLYFRTAEYGSDETVSINVSSGSFAMDGGTTSDSGVDATVTVNGQTTIADGMQITYSSGSTSVNFTLKEDFGKVAGGTTSFSITGGGANFALDANPANRINTGIASLNSSYLGNDSLGYLSSLKSGGANAIASGNYQAAGNIAQAASQQVATTRARLGAIQSYSVNATLSSLDATKNALTSARSNIEDTDYTSESANNQHLQMMVQVGAQILGAMNTNANTVLSLLGIR